MGPSTVGHGAPLNPSAPVLLVGYFGHGNAGDEWIARALTDALHPLPVAAVVGPHPAPGYAPVPRSNFRALWRTLRASRAVVYGGGELFQSQTSFRSFFYYLFFALAARLLGRPLAAYGVSIDESLPRFLRFFLAMSLRRASVWCRDERSAAMLSEAGLPVDRVPDSVWARGLLPVAPPKTLRRILWVLRFPPGRENPPDWADRLNALALSKDWEHAFLLLQPDQDAPGLARFRAHLNFFHREEKWESPEAVFEIPSRYDLVVSMRFHGLVSAALARRPAVGLALHGKVERLAQDMGALTLPWEGSPEVWEEILSTAFQQGPAEVARWAEDARQGLADLARWSVSAPGNPASSREDVPGKL